VKRKLVGQVAIKASFEKERLDAEKELVKMSGHHSTSANRPA
jgi:hypothetical protein